MKFTSLLALIIKWNFLPSRKRQWAQMNFGKSFTSVYQEVLQTLVEKGLLEIDQEYCRLTQEGRALGNEVFMNFI